MLNLWQNVCGKLEIWFENTKMEFEHVISVELRNETDPIDF